MVEHPPQNLGNNNYENICKPCRRNNGARIAPRPADEHTGNNLKYEKNFKINYNAKKFAQRIMN